MAKLCSCYALCPLIDRSPLGVTADSDAGCVIVTLGKNIVIRYKLADQKQASSWSSKDKLSAPVIYDQTGQRYVAVFTQSLLRMWSTTEVDLNKIKKIKFEDAIFIVLSRSPPLPPVVVFKGGYVVSLPVAVENRKNKWPSILPDGFSIRDCQIVTVEDEDSVAIQASDDAGKCIFLLVGIGKSKGKCVRVPLERVGLKLLGQTTMQVEGNLLLLTLWSDGQLYSLPLSRSTSSEDGLGRLIYSITAVSTKNPVVMTQIANNHVAMYGADSSEEGAMLIIFNTQFLLVQARQHYKMFADNANLWVIGTSLLLIVGHSLAVAPFILDTERLSALVGSHRPQQSSIKEGGEVQQTLTLECVTWDDPADTGECDKSKSARHSLRRGIKNNNKKEKSDWINSKVLETFVAQGYSQTMLCDEVVPSLIEKRNIHGLLWILSNLPDFPEAALVRVLSFCLDESADTFKRVVNGHSEIDGEDSTDGQNTLLELPRGQRKLLESILSTPFSEVVIVPLLRRGLVLPHCLAVLQFVAQSMPHSKSISFFRALLKWACVVLDSHYQQLLLSKDESVNNTIVALKELVESQVEFMDDLKLLVPLLDRLKSGQSMHKASSMNNHHYSIEVLKLY